MTTEQALLLLVSLLTTGVLTLGAVTLQRLTGSVSLELDLGGRPLARARAERDQARASAEALRNAGATVTSHVTQPLHTFVEATVENHPEASVTAELFPDLPEN